MAKGKDKELNYCYHCMKPLEAGEYLCPNCGNDNSTRFNAEDILREGAILSGKYLVGHMLGRGGFGVTYIGIDLVLGVKVAIKEYFPVGVGIRTINSSRVTTVTSLTDKDGFEKGCEEFQAEARTLAHFNSSNIVHVRDYFRENNTAYIVMDFIDGNNLSKEVTERGGKMPWDEVVELFKPLILELQKLHEEHLIHRDIKPENIKLARRNKKDPYLVLLDFGSARSFVSSQVTKTYTAMVTPGFAPVEQYSPKSHQGPFTDVYALCATMYALIGGEAPPVATDRLIGVSELKTFKSLGVHDVPDSIEKTIRHGLAERSADRPQSMQDLYDEFSGLIPVPDISNRKDEDWEADQKFTDYDSDTDNPPLSKKTGESRSKPEKRPENGKEETEKKNNKLVFIIPMILLALGAAAFFIIRSLRQNQTDSLATQTAVSLQQTQDAGEKETAAAVSAESTKKAYEQILTEAAQTEAAAEKSTQDAYIEQTAIALYQEREAVQNMSNTQSALDVLNTQAAIDRATEQAIQSETQIAQQIQLEQTSTAMYSEMYQKQTQSALDLQNTQIASEQQTEQALQIAAAVESTRQAQVHQTETQDILNLRSTQDMFDLQTAQALQTAAAQESTRQAQLHQTETQDILNLRSTQDMFDLQTAQALQTYAAQEATLGAQIRQTETQTLLDIRSTQDAYVQQTLDALQAAAGLVATREAEIHQTETQAAKNIKNTQSAETVSAIALALEEQMHQTETQSVIEIMSTQNAAEQQTAQAAQTETAWQALIEAQMHQTETQSMIEIVNTLDFIQQQTAQAIQTAAAWEATYIAQMRQTETQSAIDVMNTQIALEGQQTAEAQQTAAVFATFEAQMHGTETQTAIDIMNTQIALEGLQTVEAQQTAAAFDATYEAQMHGTETQSAADVMNTQNAIELQTVQVLQTFEAWRKTEEAKPTATSTPTPTATSTPTPVMTATPSPLPVTAKPTSTPGPVHFVSYSGIVNQPNDVGVILRNVPSNNGNIMRSILNGNTVTITGERRPSGGVFWAKVTTKEGHTGWIWESAIAISPDIEPGDTFTFGSYEQDKDPASTEEAIEWQVLAAENDRILVISNYGLDVVRQSGSDTSLLQKWLNGEFFNDAFNESEQQWIVPADSPEGDGRMQGKIFLLSADEIGKYFTKAGSDVYQLTDFAAENSGVPESNAQRVLNWWMPASGREPVTDTDGSAAIVIRPAFWMDISGLESNNMLLVVTPTAEPHLTLTPISIPGAIGAGGGSQGSGSNNEDEYVEGGGGGSFWN